ncbi:unnamed protein product [Cuscuta campestris]|uniref:Uncharacterized protein n=1 Tax=Cuscuta campestris TaxID=132261 RepID=A0A484LAZ7_9ASTE|nr:unnamed protein product [Cuscuta campestris]
MKSSGSSFPSKVGISTLNSSLVMITEVFDILKGVKDEEENGAVARMVRNDGWFLGLSLAENTKEGREKRDDVEVDLYGSNKEMREACADYPLGMFNTKL